MATVASDRLFGKSIKRREDPRFITGRGQYVDDLKLPGMTYAAFVRSPHAHARIRKIDAAAAKRHPGVVAVFTGKDMTGVNSLPCGWDLRKEKKIPGVMQDLAIVPHMPLTSDTARHVGDPVAVVIADSHEAAVDGAEKVQVDWEPLPSVTVTENAARSGAPQLHEGAPGNVAFKWEIGDRAATDAAFKSAAVTVKKRIVNQRLVANAMEPRACVARYEDATGDLTLWVTSQNPHVHRLLMCAFVLGIPEHKVRVIAPDVGGGFGSKIFLYNEEVVCSWASRRLKRPVRWTATRSEAYLTDAHGRDHVTDAEIALSKDGKMLGLRARGADLSLRHLAQRRLHDRRDPLRGDGHLLQHDRGGCLPRRRAAGGLLRRRADRRSGCPRSRDGRRGAPEEELHPEVLRRVPDARRRQLRQRRLRRGVRPSPPDARLPEVPRRPGGRAQAGATARHRLLGLHRSLLDRAVETRRRARGRRRSL